MENQGEIQFLGKVELGGKTGFLILLRGKHSG